MEELVPILVLANAIAIAPAFACLGNTTAEKTRRDLPFRVTGELPNGP